MKILSVEECAKITGEIRGSAKALQALVHSVAFSCLTHIRDTGDTRGALALVTALPNGQRVEGLKAWFTGMSSSKITFGKDGDTGETTIKLAKDRVPANFLMIEAEATDYGSYTKEAKPRTLSVDQLIKMLSDKANNTELNTDGSPKVSVEARQLAGKFIASYNSAVTAALQ